MYVINEPKIFSFKKVGIKGKIFLTDKLIDKSQYVLIETEKGHKTTIIERKCDFIYYIIKGKGYFIVNDKREDCKKGDLVVVPHGIKFTYKGSLKMLLVISPAWKEDQEVTLD